LKKRRCCIKSGRLHVINDFFGVETQKSFFGAGNSLEASQIFSTNLRKKKIPPMDSFEDFFPFEHRYAQKMPRSDSASSNDTMLSECPTEIVDAFQNKSKATVEAYCTFNMWLVRIPFPVADDGWVYQADLGGLSQHRWDFNNTLSIMLRHTTCTRGVKIGSGSNEECRNCQMKHVWRRECISPNYMFFVGALGSTGDATKALNSMILDAKLLDQAESQKYVFHAPKVSSFRKRLVDVSGKTKRLHKIQQHFLGATDESVRTSLHYDVATANESLLFQFIDDHIMNDDFEVVEKSKQKTDEADKKFELDNHIGRSLHSMSIFRFAYL
jgi:hypothetical protein